MDYVFTNASRLVLNENTSKGIWCSGKQWVTSASKSDGSFWFDVDLLLHLNSISFAFFAFSFSLAFPFSAICCFNSALFLSPFTLDSGLSTRRMLTSGIRALFNCLFSAIFFSKFSSNTNSVSALLRIFQYHLLHHFQLHLIMHIFYCRQCLNLFLHNAYSNPRLNLFFKSKIILQIQVFCMWI